MLEQLDRELNAAGIHLAFVELRDRLKELTLRYGLMDTLDKDHFYPSIEAAIAAIRSEGGGKAQETAEDLANPVSCFLWPSPFEDSHGPSLVFGTTPRPRHCLSSRPPWY